MSRRGSGRSAGEDDERVLLAVALAVRAVRRGSVCVALARAADDAPELPWPDPADVGRRRAGLARCSTRACCGSSADLLYLDRYHRLEAQVCDDLVARAAQPPPAVDEARARGGGGPGARRARQRRAGRGRRGGGARGWTTILTGGPGTGKTTTVARLLALLADQAASRASGSRSRSAPPPARPRAGCRKPCATELAGPAGSRRGRARVGRPQARDPAPAARLAARQRHPLPARPRQPAQARRRRRRRVVDGRADDDGAAARGAAARQPGWSWSATRDQLTSVGAGAVLGDLVRGLRAADRLASRRADHELPVRARHRGLAARAARRWRADADDGARCPAHRRPTRSRSSRRHRRRPGRRPARRRRRGGAAGPRARRGRDAAGALGRARRPPAVVRPSRGAFRRPPLERPGRALARRGGRPDAAADLRAAGTSGGRCW